MFWAIRVKCWLCDQTASPIDKKPMPSVAWRQFFFVWAGGGVNHVKNASIQRKSRTVGRGRKWNVHLLPRRRGLLFIFVASLDAIVRLFGVDGSDSDVSGGRYIPRHSCCSLLCNGHLIWYGLTLVSSSWMI